MDIKDIKYSPTDKKRHSIYKKIVGGKLGPSDCFPLLFAPQDLGQKRRLVVGVRAMQWDIILYRPLRWMSCLLLLLYIIVESDDQ